MIFIKKQEGELYKEMVADLKLIGLPFNIEKLTKFLDDTHKEYSINGYALKSARNTYTLINYNTHFHKFKDKIDKNIKPLHKDTKINKKVNIHHSKIDVVEKMNKLGISYKLQYLIGIPVKHIELMIDVFEHIN